jgi:ABC-2 type transport system permease protein
MTTPRGEVYDIGYQRYEGQREGRARARKSLWVNGVRNALGIGRGWTAKVLPILLLIALMLPAVVFTIIASVVGDFQGIPGHSDYYFIASIILIVFSAIVAPELLCSDRRSGVIFLYLVRPISTTDYVIGRWSAFLAISLVYVYLPQLFLFVGRTLATTDQWDYISDNWTDIPRFLASGLVLALFTSTLPMAIAAFTTRRSLAAAFVIGLWVICSATSAALLENTSGNASDWASLIAIGNVPIYINDMIFADASSTDLSRAAADLPRVAVIGWYVALVAVPGALLWNQYRRLFS